MFDVCGCAFCVMFALGMVLWIDLTKGFYIYEVLKCVFAYDGVCLS